MELVQRKEIDKKKDNIKAPDKLRSWVQIIPPGPLFPVVQIRYCFEFNFNNCRTKSLAMYCCSPTTISNILLNNLAIVTLAIAVILFAARQL